MDTLVTCRPSHSRSDKRGHFRVATFSWFPVSRSALYLTLPQYDYCAMTTNHTTNRAPSGSHSARQRLDRERALCGWANLVCGAACPVSGLLTALSGRRMPISRSTQPDRYGMCASCSRFRATRFEFDGQLRKCRTHLAHLLLPSAIPAEKEIRPDPSPFASNLVALMPRQPLK